MLYDVPTCHGNDSSCPLSPPLPSRTVTSQVGLVQLSFPLSRGSERQCAMTGVADGS
jgi:hypothetical protein